MSTRKSVFAIVSFRYYGEFKKYEFALDGYSDTDCTNEMRFNQPYSFQHSDIVKCKKGFMRKVGNYAKYHNLYFVNLDFAIARILNENGFKHHWARVVNTKWSKKNKAIRANGKTYHRIECSPFAGHHNRNCNTAIPNVTNIDIMHCSKRTADKMVQHSPDSYKWNTSSEYMRIVCNENMRNQSSTTKGI